MAENPTEVQYDDEALNIAAGQLRALTKIGEVIDRQAALMEKMSAQIRSLGTNLGCAVFLLLLPILAGVVIGCDAFLSMGGRK